MNEPLKRPDIVVNHRPCRTGLLLLFIVIATAVIGFDRYATTAALDEIKVEKQAKAQVIPLCEAWPDPCFMPAHAVGTHGNNEE